MKRIKWLVLILVLCCGYLFWNHRHCCKGGGQGASEDPGLLLDRLWVDSQPKKPTDFIHALVVASQVPIGIFQKVSSYRLLVERFEHVRERGNLRLRFPQTNRTERLTYRIRACNDLPPYDLCLDLSRNPWEGGPVHYYGSRVKRDADAAGLQRALDALTPTR